MGISILKIDELLSPSQQGLYFVQLILHAVHVVDSPSSNKPRKNKGIYRPVVNISNLQPDLAEAIAECCTTDL
jgi:hypothetical protein